MDQYKNIIKYINYYKKIVLEDLLSKSARVYIDKIEILRKQLKHKLKEEKESYKNELLLKEYREYVLFIEQLLYKPIYNIQFKKYLSLIEGEYESVKDIDYNLEAKNELLEALERVKKYYKTKKRTIADLRINSLKKSIEKLSTDNKRK